MCTSAHTEMVPVKQDGKDCFDAHSSSRSQVALCSSGCMCEESEFSSLPCSQQMLREPRLCLPRNTSSVAPDIHDVLGAKCTGVAESLCRPAARTKLKRIECFSSVASPLVCPPRLR